MVVIDLMVIEVIGGVLSEFLLNDLLYLFVFSHAQMDESRLE